MDEGLEESGMVGAGVSGEAGGAGKLAESAPGRSRVVVRSAGDSVGVGETAVVVGAGARRGVGAVRAGSVGPEGEKW